MKPATTNKISHNLGITSPRILGAKLKKPSRKTIHKGFHVQNATTTNQSLPCLRQHNYLRWTAGRMRIIPNECEAIRLLVELGRKTMKGDWSHPPGTARYAGGAIHRRCHWAPIL